MSIAGAAWNASLWSSSTRGCCRMMQH